MKHHYTYMLHGDISYIGVRSSKCLPENDIKYWGSSKHTPKNISETHTKLILAEFPTRDEAMEHERGLHKFYDIGRNSKFYNKAIQTSTGFDTTGLEGSLSPNHDKRIHHFVHLDGKEFIGTQYDFRKRHNITSGHLSRVINGEIKTIQNWRLNETKLEDICRAGTNHPYHDKRIFHFLHPEHGEEKCTKYSLYTRYKDLTPQDLNGLHNGKLKSTKGWRLFGTNIEDLDRTGKNHPNYNGVVFRFLHLEYGEEQCTQYALRAKYNDILSSSLSMLCSGKLESTKGWCLTSDKLKDLYHRNGKHPKCNLDIFQFIHPDHGYKECTQHVMYTTYDNLTPQGVNLLCKRKIKTTKGWRINYE